MADTPNKPEQSKPQEEAADKKTADTLRGPVDTPAAAPAPVQGRLGAEYVLNTKSFLAGNLIPAGTRILWNGEPGPHMTPLNEIAEAALADYYKRHPNANLNPVRDLPLSSADELTVLALPSKEDRGEKIHSLAEMALVDPTKV